MRLPLPTQIRRAGLEDRIGQVEADDAMNRRAEVHAERLAARRALDLDRLQRSAEAGRESAVIELHDEVAAAALVRDQSTRNVIAAIAVGRRGQTRRRHEPDAGQPRLTRVLSTIAIGIVVDLAHDIGAVEVGIRHETHGRSCFVRYLVA